MNILRVVSSIGNARMVSLCHSAAPGTYNTTSLKENVFPTLQKSVPLQTAIQRQVLLDFSLTVKAATLLFISGCGSAISSAKKWKSGFIYNLVKS